MIELNGRQRTVLINTLPQTANVAAGGLLFGQFVGSRQFSMVLALVGLVAWAALIGWSMFLARRNQS